MAKQPSQNFETPAQPSAASAVNPASLSIEEVSRLLSAAGGLKITAEQVQADLDAGTPAGADGRINLVHYAAWLAREVQAR
jgi:hypothetical protein